MHYAILFRIPDTANVKEKMIYASSKDALKKKLGDGIGLEVQANDESDLGLSEIKLKAKQK
jgi:hypothetical protein